MLRKLLLLTLIAFLLCGAARAQKVEADVDFCQFSLPDEVKDAHASFTLGLTFRVDQNGKPTDINFILKPSLDKSVEEAEVIECVKGWTMAGLPADTRVNAYWRWNHGSGWDELRVSGSGFNIRIRASGNKCPYTRRSK